MSFPVYAYVSKGLCLFLDFNPEVLLNDDDDKKANEAMQTESANLFVLRVCFFFFSFCFIFPGCVNKYRLGNTRTSTRSRLKWLRYLLTYFCSLCYSERRGLWVNFDSSGGSGSSSSSSSSIGCELTHLVFAALVESIGDQVRFFIPILFFVDVEANISLEPQTEGWAR